MNEPNPSVGDTTGRRGARVERVAALCFLVSALAAIRLAVVYWTGGQTQAEGVLLAVVTAGIGVGVVLWVKHFMPHHDDVEERATLTSSEEDIAAFYEDFHAGEENLRSRRLLLRSAIGALGAFGVALIFPIRSLGPRPGKGLKQTAYARGNLRVVTQDGAPVRPGDLDPGGVLTVWPQGHLTEEDQDAQTLLIRPPDFDQDFRPREGREDWTQGGVVAYSKICTHAGCPVGLYEQDEGLLLCPCHQSTFKVNEWCKPVFGPATRSLPQLPLGVDDEGYLIARADFSGPVGPGFWDRGR